MAADTTEDREAQNLILDLLATVLLFLAISTVVSALTAIAEAGMRDTLGSPVIQTEHYENSPGSVLWLMVCCCGSAVLWRFAKPSPKVWTLPFLLASGWSWLSLMFLDEGIDEVAAAFTRRMLFACCGMTILGIMRLILG